MSLSCLLHISILSLKYKFGERVLCYQYMQYVTPLKVNTKIYTIKITEQYLKINSHKIIHIYYMY